MRVEIEVQSSPWNCRITPSRVGSPSIVFASAAAPSAVSSLPGPAAESSSASLGVVPAQPERQLGRHLVAGERRAVRAELGAVQEVRRLQHRSDHQRRALREGALGPRQRRARVVELMYADVSAGVSGRR